MILLSITHNTVSKHWSEDKTSIRDNLNENMMSPVGIDLSTFEQSFTFVIDCAATMTTDFRASVPLGKIQYGERCAVRITQKRTSMTSNKL